MKDRIFKFRAPLYLSAITFIVTDDLIKTRKKYDAQMGSYGLGPAGALLSYNEKNQYLLIIERSSLGLDAIGHEIFHLTHRILESACVPFSENNHEPFAYLCGWLTAIIMRKITQWKEKLK